MPSPVNTGFDTLNALQQLPKDKDILDFVWRKLSEKSGPEKSEMIRELLEMYRTSSGFDPLEISKGRVKRVKASDFKKTLIEINESLNALVNGADYRELLMKNKNLDSVLPAFKKIRAMLEKNEFTTEVSGEINNLKKDLVDIEEYELLLSLYRLCQSFYESKYENHDISSLIEEYNQVKLMAELNGEHTLTGLKTIQLVKDSEKGNRNNQALVNLYDQLCKLLIRQSGTKSKYETLTRIIKVSAHLENKKHYMEPYLAFTQTHFEEIVHVLPASASELNITLAVFLNREPLPVRLGYLNKAISEANKNQAHHELALFKIIHAELCCDAHDYDQALKMLDESDYILLKTKFTEHTGEIKLRSAQTRFYIYALLLLEGRRIVDLQVFDELIRIAVSSGSKRSDLAVIELELNGLFNFVQGKFIEAKSLFIKSAKIRENQSNPVCHTIDTFFQELLRKTPDHELLKTKIHQLEQLKETFYSTHWVRILKSATIKREIYGEVAL